MSGQKKRFGRSAGIGQIQRIEHGGRQIYQRIVAVERFDQIKNHIRPQLPQFFLHRVQVKSAGHREMFVPQAF